MWNLETLQIFGTYLDMHTKVLLNTCQTDHGVHLWSDGYDRGVGQKDVPCHSYLNVLIGCNICVIRNLFKDKND
jgi:hypothetical protein